MDVIWGITLLITLLGCIPYAIWAIYTAFKRRWKRLGLQVIIPIVYYILLLGVTKIADSWAYDSYLRNLYDTEVDLGNPVYEYDSGRSFHGDGFSISVYILPQEIRSRFEAADERLLTDYPKLPDYRSRWQGERWRESPLDEDHKKYLDFALLGGDNSTITHSAAIRRALSQEGAYYSLFYYDHGESPGNVDLFVIDLVGGRLYVVNLNT